MSRDAVIPAILVVFLMVAGTVLVFLYRERSQLMQQRDSLIYEVEALRSESRQEILPSAMDIRTLQEELHRDDPLEFLRQDLLEHGNSLISTEPVLGGTMGFHSPESIHILNDRWAFARFEDGHIGGQTLLEFEIRSSIDDERIHVEWERMAETVY